MPSYVHRGVVQPNGRVDTSQSITNPAVLTGQPVDDALRLTSLEIGNFEWWYFDLIDARSDYVLKLVAHLGTDPLRTRFYPTVAIAVWTPHGSTMVRQRFVMDDFQASRDTCDVTIKDAWHVFLEPGTQAPMYHLMVHLPTFRATHGSLADAAGHLGGEEDHGKALYEAMYVRRKVRGVVGDV